MTSVASVLLSPLPECFHDNSQAQYLFDACDHRIGEGWGLMRHKIIGDGNCFYSAVAFYILNNLDTFSQFSLIQSLSKEQALLSHHLRVMVVPEWREYSHDYEAYFIGTDVIQEAELFLSTGHFNSTLDNSVVLALANAMSTPRPIDERYR